ncbi:MAG TPA: tetratricopeptide repeat protein [Polyangium sp.]|nr:tetratricopeptide repeat protein [Polyangium sp.]
MIESGQYEVCRHSTGLFSRTRALRPLWILLFALAAGCDRTAQAQLDDHLQRGDKALAEGHYAEALTAYRHAHDLAPTSAQVQRAQMWVRVALMADRPSNIGPESLEDIAYEAKVLLDAPDTGERKRAICLAALGNLFARKGDFDQAKTKLVEATKADSTSAIAHAALGMLLLGRTDQVAAAKVELELALQLEPKSVTALLGMGRAKLAEGDLPGAIRQFEASLVDSDDPVTRTMIGNVRFQQHQYAEAVEQLTRAVNLDPKSADAFSLLGQAQLGQGKLDEAEQALRAALQIRQDEQTTIALGFTMARMKRSEQALAIFGQVLTTNPNAAPALFGMGIANEDLGRTEQAITVYRRVLDLPAEGQQKAVVAEVQKETRGRLAQLTAASLATSAATSASAPASSPPPRAAPPSTSPLGQRQ